MRITVITFALTPGGVQRSVSILMNYWAERNDEVTLITLSTEATDFFKINPKVKRIALGLFFKDSRTIVEAVANNLAIAARLRRAIKLSNPDIVISFETVINIMTLLASRGLGLKIIVSERTIPVLQRLGRKWKWLRRRTFPWANAVVVQTDHVRQLLLRTVKNEAVHVIPNPALRINGRQPDGKSLSDLIKIQKPFKTVAGMGRLSKEKGFDLLIKAFAKIASSHPEWHLIIFGEGTIRGCLTSLANDLGIRDRFHLPGTIDDPAHLLLQSDLFVFSSHYEGFGNALVEAMSCGLPVISFDCPSGPGEIIRNGIDGVLVPPGDIDALAAAMDRLMSDKRECERLSSRAVEVTERFALEKIMGQWDTLIRKTTEC